MAGFRRAKRAASDLIYAPVAFNYEQVVLPKHKALLFFWSDTDFRDLGQVKAPHLDFSDPEIR